jgi:hypothetical protein
MYAILKNIGISPAINVKVYCKPKIEGPIMGDPRETTITAHTIAMLAPGREISDYISGNAVFFSTYRDLLFDVTLEYEDVSGTKYKEAIKIDLTFQREHISEAEKDIGVEIEKLRKSLEQVLASR